MPRRFAEDEGLPGESWDEDGDDIQEHERKPWWMLILAALVVIVLFFWAFGGF
jgi:hypothetical protein